MNIVIRPHLIATLGWETALVLAVIEYHFGAGNPISIEQAVSLASGYRLTESEMRSAINRLVEEGRLAQTDTAIGSIIELHSVKFEVTSKVFQFLRQRGLDAPTVRLLAQTYAVETTPDERSSENFAIYALRSVPTTATSPVTTWNPSQNLIISLTSEGVSTEFIHLSIPIFKLKYDPAKGGGDLERNFYRFVLSTWSQHPRTISPHWLPREDDNQYLQSMGHRESTIISQAILFRRSKLEKGELSADWSSAFVTHMETIATLSIFAVEEPKPVLARHENLDHILTPV